MGDRVVFYGGLHDCGSGRPLNLYARIAAETLDAKNFAELLGVKKGLPVLVRPAQDHWLKDGEGRIFEVAIVPPCTAKAWPEIRASLKEAAIANMFVDARHAALWEVVEESHPETFFNVSKGVLSVFIIALNPERGTVAIGLSDIIVRHFGPALKSFLAEAKTIPVRTDVEIMELPLNCVRLDFHPELGVSFLKLCDSLGQPLLMVHSASKGVDHIHFYRSAFADGIKTARWEIATEGVKVVFVDARGGHC